MPEIPIPFFHFPRESVFPAVSLPGFRNTYEQKDPVRESAVSPLSPPAFAYDYNDSVSHLSDNTGRSWRHGDMEKADTPVVFLAVLPLCLKAARANLNSIALRLLEFSYYHEDDRFNWFRGKGRRYDSV